jgi:hypothetical protein
MVTGAYRIAVIERSLEHNGDWCIQDRCNLHTATINVQKNGVFWDVTP